MGQKKLSLKSEFENTLEDRELFSHFFKNPLQEGDFENSWGNSPTLSNSESHMILQLQAHVPQFLNIEA